MRKYNTRLFSQVEVTKFEDLEDTQNELKLKTTLWNAQGEWDRYQEEWMMVRCVSTSMSVCIHTYVCTYIHTVYTYLLTYNSTFVCAMNVATYVRTFICYIHV